MGASEIVVIGRLLGDATRVAMLDALFDGRAYTVSELARHAKVATSTASEHLAKLLDGGLVALEAQGRHRYYRLASPEAAALLETLYEVTSHQPIERATRVPADLVYARSCYDHLAGTVAVALAEHLVDIGALAHHDSVPQLTDSGRDLFAAIGIDTTSSTGSGRPLVRHCLDWSERRHHLAGALPAALLGHMLTEHWCARRKGRSLQVTETGRHRLQQHLGFDISNLTQITILTHA